MIGFINVDKQPGQTSRDAVNAVQRLVRPAKIGHCGTLDPLATGVLVVCVGPATRLTNLVQEAPKTYVGDFRLGVSSETEDIEGELVPLVDAPAITAVEIEDVLPEFVGEIQQLPPKFSALKIDGKRAYDLARQGKEVNLKPRQIQVYSLRITAFEYPKFQLEIECGTGTYVRSLGRDIGARVGSAAIMTALQRTAIGSFKVATGVNAEELNAETISQHLLPVEHCLAGLEKVAVNDAQARGLIDAQPLILPAYAGFERIVAVDKHGRVLAVLNRRDDHIFTPKINFSKYWNG
ncbi:tRNA pseudouridine(55) synthase TruB [Mariniblastus sp.]|nr:tRNA pseudouridine(55) synthase TruB [Mariniblastus sp.]